MWLNNDSDGHFSIQVTDGANQQELFVGNDATSEKVMVRCAAGGGGYTPQVTYTTAGIKRLLLKPSMHLRVSSDGTNLTYAIG
ncbi:hypothetical protein, partial [Streptococcus pneumoniae]|uniref:hypothetical protein n=1 Tax=Streptococcus pneumoniae TaxID=1313 RepID=UPI001E615512